MGQPAWVAEVCLELVKRLRFDQVQGLSLSGGLLPEDPDDGPAIQAAVERYLREAVLPLIDAIATSDRKKAQQLMRRRTEVTEQTMAIAVDAFYDQKRVSRIVERKREAEARERKRQEIMDSLPTGEQVMKRARAEKKAAEVRFRQLQQKYEDEFAKIMGRRRAREFVALGLIGARIREEAQE